MPVCAICQIAEDDPVNYGEFMKKSGIAVHYYCLLLSTHLPQKGLDQSGILGFLLRDIRKEIQSCAERTCCYCKQPYASIACFICKKYFHQICGSKNDCVSEFVNEFHSYCHKHVPFKDELKLTKPTKSTCWICEDPIGNFSPTQTLRAYCCQNGYVHRNCLRKYALGAGYRLICIWCTGKEFRNDVRKHGVFVPDREAYWDNNETLRYTDLYRGYSHCDAEKCICTKGREFFSGQWKLMVCCVCGASGVHEQCGQINIQKDKYTCNVCKNIITKTQNSNEPSRKNMAFNYTMFMAKTYEESEDIAQGHGIPHEVKIPEERTSSFNTSKQTIEPQTENPSTSTSSQHSSVVKELFMFDKDSNIIGNVKVQQDKLHQKGDKLVCNQEDIIEFCSSDKLLKSIFADIVAEGRELSMDMVDEVFERLKLSLETFGDEDS